MYYLPTCDIPKTYSRTHSTVGNAEGNGALERRGINEGARLSLMGVLEGYLIDRGQCCGEWDRE